MDYLKQQVVDSVFARVKQVDGDGVYDVYDEPPTINVMEQVENLSILLNVKTPGGPRFFLIKVSEVY